MPVGQTCTHRLQSMQEPRPAALMSILPLALTGYLVWAAIVAGEEMLHRLVLLFLPEERYWTGMGFLLSIRRPPLEASPVTIARYALYYGSMPRVRVRLVWSSALGLACIAAVAGMNTRSSRSKPRERPFSSMIPTTR